MGKAIARSTAMPRLVAVWVLVLFCHALSAEVEELAPDQSEALATVAKKEAQHAIETAERKESLKSAMKAYKEAFGTEAVLKGEDKLAWSKERKSMEFVKSLKKEVEEFTGKKIRPDKMEDSANMFQKGARSKSIQMHNLMKELGKEEKKIMGKKRYKKLGKFVQPPKTANDVMKEMKSAQKDY